MFTYADADCDGRIRYRSQYNERCFPRLSPQIFSSWSEFQTMIIPQPVGGVGVSGGGAWAKAVTRPPPGPAPCTLSVSGLARVAPSGNPWSPHIMCISSMSGPGGVAMGGPLQTSWEQMGVAQPAAQWLLVTRVYWVLWWPLSAALTMIRWHRVISGDPRVPLKIGNCNHCAPSHQMIDTIDKNWMSSF